MTRPLSEGEKARRAFERLEKARKKAGRPVPRRGPEAYQRRKLLELSRTGKTPYQRQKTIAIEKYGVATPKQRTREIVRVSYLRLTKQRAGSELDEWIQLHPRAAVKAYAMGAAQRAEREAGAPRMSRAQWQAMWDDPDFEDMPTEGLYYNGD